MTYVSPSSVLQEAGLWDRQVGENLSGTVNGSNTVFTSLYKPLVQLADAENVTTADVSAYVDGVPVTVSSVNATTGALTLASAPSGEAVVTGDYVSSALSSAVVAGAIEEAEDWIALEVSGVYTIPATNVSPTLRKIARFYAAGLLMSREYGLESVTEETTKEGKRKIEQAEKWLAEFRARYTGNTATTGGYNVPRSTADQRLFQGQNDPSTGVWGPLDEDVLVQRPRP